jgi:hypothetical protein
MPYTNSEKETMGDMRRRMHACHMRRRMHA